MTLPELPQNRALLDLLRQQGVPQERGSYAYEGWELHAHPDLVERLEDLAPQWPVLATFGVPVLAAKDIAAVVAWGTGILLVRRPEAPTEPLEFGEPCPPLTDPGQGWYSVCPWQSELHSAESQAQLSLSIRHALSHAATLSEDDSIDWQGRAVQAPGARKGKAAGDLLDYVSKPANPLNELLRGRPVTTPLTQIGSDAENGPVTLNHPGKKPTPIQVSRDATQIATIPAARHHAVLTMIDSGLDLTHHLDAGQLVTTLAMASL